jgi:hypothetical protein
LNEKNNAQNFRSKSSCLAALFGLCLVAVLAGCATTQEVVVVKPSGAKQLKR